MRGVFSTGRVLPLIPAPLPTSHRCTGCEVDLCHDLRVLGFSEYLVAEIHGGRGIFQQLTHREARCFRCESEFRSRY